jgi:hypothetical protein
MMLMLRALVCRIRGHRWKPCVFMGRHYVDQCSCCTLMREAQVEHNA